MNVSGQWIALLFYKIGSLSFVLLGAGHLATYFSAPETVERLNVIHAMQRFTINLAGTESNLFLFHEGFSLMMGILLIAYGLLNFDIIRKVPDIILSSAFLLRLNLVVSFVSLAISIHYFFLIPILFTAISLICFLSVIGLTIKSARHHSSENE